MVCIGIKGGRSGGCKFQANTTPSGRSLGSMLLSIVTSSSPSSSSSFIRTTTSDDGGGGGSLAAASKGCASAPRYAVAPPYPPPPLPRRPQMHMVTRLRGGSEQALAEAFEKSLIGVSEFERTQAEKNIFAMEKQPGFLHNLMSIIAHRKDNPRSIALQAAAVRFKNTVKAHWALKPDDDDAVDETDEKDPQFLISEPEKTEVKRVVLELLCDVPVIAQQQLTDAIQAIAMHDFPQKWLSLLPEIRDRLAANLGAKNFQAMAGLVEAADSVLERFRDPEVSTREIEQLRFSLETLQQPILEVFTALTDMVVADAEQGQQQQLGTAQDDRKAYIYKVLRFVTRIHVTFCSTVLPAFFEDTIAKWMTMYHKLLLIRGASTSKSTDGGQFDLGIDSESDRQLLELHTNVVEALSLFVGKHEDQYKPFLSQLTRDVWTIAIAHGEDVTYDRLVTNAIGYLTTVSGQPWNRNLFEGDGAIAAIVERICIPNLMMRHADRESFADSPYLYVKDNIDGSQTSTRSKSATDLIRRLLVQFEDEVTSLCMRHIERLMDQYDPEQDNDRWQAKYTALSLFLAVSIKGTIRQYGATTLNTKVNIAKFLQDQVFASLATVGPKTQPELIALLLKALMVFRLQLSQEDVLAITPSLTKLLKSSSYVVHSYTAAILQRFVTMTPIGDKFRRQLSPEAVHSVLVQTFDPLLQIITSESYLHNLWPYNKYAMSALMDMLGFSPPKSIQPLLPQVMVGITTMVKRLTVEPNKCADTTFTHDLFETLAIVVRVQLSTAMAEGRSIPQPGEGGIDTAATGKLLAVVAELEAALFPFFQEILQSQLEDLMPYVFQVIAMLLEATPGDISPTYLSLFQPILAPCNWQMAGNVPGLVRLLQAYLKKGCAQLLATQGNVVDQIIRVAELLMQSRRTEQSGMKVLVGLVETLDAQLLAPVLERILAPCVKKLGRSNTVPLSIRRFGPVMNLLSVLVGKHGITVLKSKLDAETLGRIQARFWTEFLPKIKSRIRRKAALIATTRMIVEDGTIWDIPGLPENMFKALIETLLSASAEPAEKDNYLSVLEDEGDRGVRGTRLAHSRDRIHDPFEDVPGVEGYIARSLSQLSDQRKGYLSSALRSLVPEDKLSKFRELCAKVGVQVI